MHFNLLCWSFSCSFQTNSEDFLCQKFRDFQSYNLMPYACICRSKMQHIHFFHCWLIIFIPSRSHLRLLTYWLLEHFRSFSHFHVIFAVPLQHVQFTLFFLLFCRRYKLNMNVVEKWIYIYVLLSLAMQCMQCVHHTHPYCVRLWACGFKLHRLPLIVCRENVQFLRHVTMKEIARRKEIKRKRRTLYLCSNFRNVWLAKAYSAAIKKHGISKNSFNNLNVVVYGITCGYMDVCSRSLYRMKWFMEIVN